MIYLHLKIKWKKNGKIIQNKMECMKMRKINKFQILFNLFKIKYIN
jgi:hypothetical protein